MDELALAAGVDPVEFRAFGVPAKESADRYREAVDVVLATAHLDHNPGNNRLGNLRSFCQRCHLIHDRPHHLARRRITYLLRRALGDLFLGPYSA